MLPVNNDYNYKCKINGKDVYFRPWKSKDEKNFLTLMEAKEEITDDDFKNILILPCLKDKDIYLSEADLQYLLIEIRKQSISDEFEMKFICKNEKCKSVNEIDVNFDDIVDYKPDNVKIFKDENLIIHFGNIKNIQIFEEKIKDVNHIEKNFIEMIMRIEKIIINDKEYNTFTYDEVYNYINELEVKQYDKLIKYYNDNKSNMNIEGTFNCAFCGHENSFYFDEIPNFLANW